MQPDSGVVDFADVDRRPRALCAVGAGIDAAHDFLLVRWVAGGRIGCRAVLSGRVRCRRGGRPGAVPCQYRRLRRRGDEVAVVDPAVGWADLHGGVKPAQHVHRGPVGRRRPLAEQPGSGVDQSAIRPGAARSLAPSPGSPARPRPMLVCLRSPRPAAASATQPCTWARSLCWCPSWSWCRSDADPQ